MKAGSLGTWGRTPRPAAPAARQSTSAMEGGGTGKQSGVVERIRMQRAASSRGGVAP